MQIASDSATKLQTKWKCKNGSFDEKWKCEREGLIRMGTQDNVNFNVKWKYKIEQALMQNENVRKKELQTKRNCKKDGIKRKNIHKVLAQGNGKMSTKGTYHHDMCERWFIKGMSLISYKPKIVVRCEFAILIATTKYVPICQVISLDFVWIH